MHVAFYASMNGDSGERECHTEVGARYWEELWRKSGGRVAFVFEREGNPTLLGERPLTRYGRPVADQSA